MEWEAYRVIVDHLLKALGKLGETGLWRDGMTAMNTGREREREFGVLFLLMGE